MNYHLANNLPLDQNKKEVKKMYPRYPKKPQVSTSEESTGRRRPTLSGVVQTPDNKPVAQIALWEYEGSNPKAPAFKGTVTNPDGTKLRVSLWKRD